MGVATATEAAPTEAPPSAERPGLEPLDRGAPASWPSRAGAAAAVVLALVIGGDALDHLPISALLVAAFVGGLVAGSLPVMDRLFRWVTGWVLGAIAMGVLFTILALCGAILGTPRELMVSVPVVGLVPIGADWRWAARLRTWVLVSGVGVVAVLGWSVDTFAGMPRGRALLGSVAWLGLALATLRLLHHDLTDAVPRPSPAAGGEARPPGRRPLALLALIAASLLGVAYLAAVESSLDCGLHHASCEEREQRIRDRAAFDENVAVPTSRPVPTIPTRPELESDDGLPWLPLVVGLAIAALVLLVVVWWWTRRRRRDRGGLLLTPWGLAPFTSRWATEMAHGIDALGARYGRPRGRSEPLASYAAALGEEVLSDRRMAAVGSVVSSAFFGRREPPAEQQGWAEQVLVELETRPMPSARVSG